MGVSLLGAQMKIKDCATAICHLLGTAFLFSKERKTGGGEAAAPFLIYHFLFIFTSPQSDSLFSVEVILSSQSDSLSSFKVTLFPQSDYLSSVEGGRIALGDHPLA